MSDHLANIRNTASSLGDAEAADIFLFNGAISRNVSLQFIAAVSKRKRRPNVILVLVTSGGDADAAYRMGRCLQKHYGTITVFIAGRCKGAGTLVATAAHKLVFGEFGELGPLVVQHVKGEYSLDVGSDLNAALKQLGRSSALTFKDLALAIEQATDGRVPFKAAAEIASDLVSRLLGNIYSQIDPIRIGEIFRAIDVARDYAERLAGGSWNLQTPDSLELLVSAYASHDFVIDFEEAQSIFKDTTEATAAFDHLQEALGDVALQPISTEEEGDFMLAYLNRELADDPHSETRDRGRNANANSDEPSLGRGY